MLFLGVRGCPWMSQRLTYFVDIGHKTAHTCCGAHLELIRSLGRRGVLNLLFLGVRGCHGDLRILSIFAVRLPKLALEASRVLIRSHERWRVLNLLCVGVHGCPWVSRRFTYFVNIGRKTAKTCCGDTFGAY